ncbi:hypothetical protein GTY75_02385 [Streptomyces sp. SID8381]|uniref:hypothetical protein n=1 Tax=unclassified Streptomyces TaxID=2593676 RepID=UPI000371B33A|nr:MULTISPECIES: hypothetical protein [unclassified Streptomyces]MYX25529.1 hypothetical protein [Streptomyces sp. SID8381]
MEPAVVRAVRAARDTAGAPGPGGRVEAVLPIESVEHAAGLLPGPGAEAEAPAPTQLRALPASAVAALAETYGGAARRPSGV